MSTVNASCILIVWHFKSKLQSTNTKHTGVSGKAFIYARSEHRLPPIIIRAKYYVKDIKNKKVCYSEQAAAWTVAYANMED